ncbi:MAG: hypothetical protein IJM82_04400 [Synergistaceae bacterium]|nr:hypothetical protein [Synergistaceae bacterium]MBR0079273.1 hypothetical protein [Synergistaceae bacterium]MBR0252585.1 hypothetical protein [Synergistaceae bacterium]
MGILEKIRQWQFGLYEGDILKKFRLYRGELIPDSCGFITSVSRYDKYGDQILDDPENVPFSNVETYFRKQVKHEDSMHDNCKRDPVMYFQRSCYRRAGFWEFCAWVHYYDKATPENVKVLKEYMELWEIDESVYFEMADIAEAYKVLTPYIIEEYGSLKLTGEAAKDKKDLDASVKAIIEVG